MSATPSNTAPLDLERFQGFTPGPWKMRREDGHGRARIGVESDLRRTVAIVSGVDWPENAGLIEAAPALLAECQRLRLETERMREEIERNRRRMHYMKTESDLGRFENVAATLDVFVEKDEAARAALGEGE